MYPGYRSSVECSASGKMWTLPVGASVGDSGEAEICLQIAMIFISLKYMLSF